MKAIKRVSLYEQVVQSIIDMIRDGEVKIGDKLPSESELSKMLGVSRNSIREAMKALSINGMIESTPGKGTFVLPKAAEMVLNVDGLVKFKQEASIAELMEVRRALEVEAAGAAARRITEEEIELFKQREELFKKTVFNRENWGAPARAFHDYIACLSGNKVLISMLRTIEKEVEIYRKMMAEQRVEMEGYLKQHEEIYEAIIARNEAEARKRMYYHLTDAEQVMKNLL